jgi:glycosyltransferase involved in cell wall biosynthesis
MKVAVYNAHWSTLGGGEQLAAGVATALAGEHDVDLLVLEPFNAAAASERLGVNLTGLSQRVIEETTQSLLAASASYDVLVNSSFSSQLPSAAKRSIYYVHFPIPYDEQWTVFRVAQRALGPLVGRGDGWTEWASGFYEREFPGDGRWTERDARLHLFAAVGTKHAAGVDLNARHWPKDREPHVLVTADGRTLFEGRMGARRVPIRLKIVGRGASDPIEIRIQTETFIPRVDMGIDDDRVLGVEAARPFVGRHPMHVPSRLTPRFLKLARFHEPFLDSYEEIVANSVYTADWVRRLWGRPSAVLSPPVLQRAPGVKQNVILSVGRFFPNESGHSKKQLELTRAFRRLIEGHGLKDWELHLVGGCTNAERGYVDSIRREAVGLPVRLHVNARGDQLEDLYARARIFWHAGGIGENAEIHPDRFEHFGISVVEAMSAADVPMVFERGGPAAIVAPGVSGLHFSSVGDLAAKTAALIADTDRLASYSIAARQRAAEFDSEHFASRVRALVRDGVGAPRQ